METKNICKTSSEIIVLPDKVGISSDFKIIENDDPDCDKNSLEKVDKHKIISLFVRDILKSEKQNDYFVIGKHKFKFVQIFGTLVSKSVTEKKITVEVHDGSSSITCFLEDDCFYKHQDENYERFQEQEKNSGNIFQVATVILFSSLRYLSSRFFLKHPDSVMRGDIVLLEGKLSEYKGKFNVFVTKLNKKTMNEFIEFLTQRKMLYEDFSVT